MNTRINRLKKIVALVLVAVMALLCLSSCASGRVAAESASGDHGSIHWDYNKENKTLTLTGEGEMAHFENADAVSWLAVRADAEKIVVDERITAIGDYAFYFMSAAKEVILPAGLLSIGKYAFAYCSALETVSIPLGVTTIGESAFEACGALTSAFVPSAVTSLGSKAFAYCYSMKNAIVIGEPVTIGSGTFKNCRSLTQVVFRTSITEEQVAPDAFEGASLSLANVLKTDSADGSSTVTVKYLNTDGSEAAPTLVETHSYGNDYVINSPVIEGYTADVLSVTGTADGMTREVTVTYTQNAPTTEDEPVEKEKKEITPMTIVALVIMGVVLVGIAVGAFLLIRSDKKSAGKNTTTVRKNGNDNGKNGKKSGR